MLLLIMNFASTAFTANTTTSDNFIEMDSNKKTGDTADDFIDLDNYKGTDTPDDFQEINV